jgi:hypothetical protein
MGLGNIFCFEKMREKYKGKEDRKKHYPRETKLKAIFKV